MQACRHAGTSRHQQARAAAAPHLLAAALGLRQHLAGRGLQGSCVAGPLVPDQLLQLQQAGLQGLRARGEGGGGAQGGAEAAAGRAAGRGVVGGRFVGLRQLSSGAASGSDSRPPPHYPSRSHPHPTSSTCTCSCPMGSVWGLPLAPSGRPRRASNWTSEARPAARSAWLCCCCSCGKVGAGQGKGACGLGQGGGGSEWYCWVRGRVGGWAGGCQGGGGAGVHCQNGFAGSWGRPSSRRGRRPKV